MDRIIPADATGHQGCDWTVTGVVREGRVIGSEAKCAGRREGSVSCGVLPRCAEQLASYGSLRIFCDAGDDGGGGRNGLSRRMVAFRIRTRAPGGATVPGRIRTGRLV